MRKLLSILAAVVLVSSTIFAGGINASAATPTTGVNDIFHGTHHASLTQEQRDARTKAYGEYLDGLVKDGTLTKEVADGYRTDSTRFNDYCSNHYDTNTTSSNTHTSSDYSGHHRGGRGGRGRHH